MEVSTGVTRSQRCGLFKIYIKFVRVLKSRVGGIGKKFLATEAIGIGWVLSRNITETSWEVMPSTQKCQVSQSPAAQWEMSCSSHTHLSLHADVCPARQSAEL